MTTTAAQSMPAVPPRPSRSADKDSSSSGSIPKIPPRPSKRPERSISPAGRFAPSPLNDGILAKGAKPALLSPYRGVYEPVEDPIARAGSVELPSVGQEGMEYSAVTEEAEKQEQYRSNSPEQTRTVAQDLKLHAPKPSLPADSAKQRVQAVTRTDSDRAAQFGIGIGRPASNDRATSRDRMQKRPSTSLSMRSDGDRTDDEHGIPQIGQRVPMNKHLGDVQAPSYASSETSSRNHSRRHSARALPPGSYGLHGHGVAPQDKLEKDYYKKHPDLLRQEEHTPIHDRQNDYAMSSADLNNLVRATANRAKGLGTDPDIRGTPTDEVAFQATDEYVRHASPRPGSGASKQAHRRSSSLAEVQTNDDDTPIHVDDPRHPEYRSFGDEDDGDENDEGRRTPILASDEVAKDKNAYLQHPAIRHRERRPSGYESDELPSRPTSRPVSLHNNNSQPEIRYTPLEDVEEYEPLFKEEARKERQAKEAADKNKHHKHFPSKDIWEDTPDSMHYTATVSTPDLPEEEHHRTRSSGHQDRSMTPAHAFAAHQEALAEQEAKRRSGSGSTFLPLSEQKPTWASHQAHLKVQRPASGPRFPSRDVWEDAPESQLQEATISSPEEEKDQTEQPEVPARPVRKEPPSVPSRPKPRQGSGDDVKAKPPVADKPKPQIPNRPTKSSSGDSKEKPPVPNRPVGGKIAALQAGFMSDLNQRLRVGPVIPKKEEQVEEAPEEKEKVPLSDARKGRARGPQRRAPAKSPAPAEAAKPSVPVLTFSLPQASWSIDPDVGSVAVDQESGDTLEKSTAAEDDLNGGETSTIQQPSVDQKPPTKEDIPIEAEHGEEPVDSAPAEAEPAVEPVETEAAETTADITEESGQVDEPRKVEQTLASNMAGESVLEATVEKDQGEKVNPVDVEDTVKA